MPPQRSPQLFANLPSTQPTAASDGHAAAAAVLAEMPTGQAQLHWVTPGFASDESSVLQPPVLSPAASSARPPLAARPLRAAEVRGMALPPRRPATLVAAASTPPRRTSAMQSGKRALGASTTLKGGADATAAGGTAHEEDGASPVSIAEAARRGARATTSPMVPVGGGGSRASTPSQPAVSRAASPGSADLHAPPSSSGVRRSSLLKAPLQMRQAPVVVPPRGLSYRVCRGGLLPTTPVSLESGRLRERLRSPRPCQPRAFESWSSRASSAHPRRR